MADMSQIQSQIRRSVTASDMADLFDNHRNDFDDGRCHGCGRRI